MTPVQMEVMLRCYYLREPESKLQENKSAAHREAICRLEEQGLIFWNQEYKCFVTSEKGDAYVEILKMVGVPEASVVVTYTCPVTGLKYRNER